MTQTVRASLQATGQDGLLVGRRSRPEGHDMETRETSGGAGLQPWMR